MGDALSPTEKKARKLYIAISDISAARDACDLFLEHVKEKDDDLYTPLLAAIIVCYARPFTNNRGYKALDAEWQKFQNKDLQEMHNTLIELRDKVIAHSDCEGRRVHFKWQDAAFGKMISSVMVESDSLTIASFQRVRETCVDLIGRLQDEADKETDRWGREERL